jgi:hypothetical protein
MKAEFSKYELPVAGSSWISSVELGAGIYFLDGRTHLAGHSSPAERALVERGALLVASIRFDGNAQESYRDAHRVRVLAAGEAVGVFRPSSRNS